MFSSLRGTGESSDDDSSASSGRQLQLIRSGQTRFETRENYHEHRTSEPTFLLLFLASGQEKKERHDFNKEGRSL
jgi:hypothetical protein